MEAGSLIRISRPSRIATEAIALRSKLFFIPAIVSFFIGRWVVGGFCRKYPGHGSGIQLLRGGRYKSPVFRKFTHFARLLELQSDHSSMKTDMVATIWTASTVLARHPDCGTRFFFLASNQTFPTTRAPKIDQNRVSVTVRRKLPWSQKNW